MPGVLSKVRVSVETAPALSARERADRRSILVAALEHLDPEAAGLLDAAARCFRVQLLAGPGADGERMAQLAWAQLDSLVVHVRSAAVAGSSPSGASVLDRVFPVSTGSSLRGLLALTALARMGVLAGLPIESFTDPAAAAVLGELGPERWALPNTAELDRLLGQPRRRRPFGSGVTLSAAASSAAFITFLDSECTAVEEEDDGRVPSLPRLAARLGIGKTTLVKMLERNGVRWIPYRRERLDRAARHGKGLFTRRLE